MERSTEINSLEKRFEIAIYKSGCLFYDWDILRDCVSCLGDTIGNVGYVPEELASVFAQWVKYVHPLDCELMEREIKQAIAAKGNFALTYRFRKKNGAYCVIENYGYPLLDKNGEVTRFVGYLKDITAVAKEINILKEKEKRYRELIESQQELIVRVDTEGCFTFVNDAYCKKFGKTQKELIGTTFMLLVHEEDLNSALEAMKGLEFPPYRIYFEHRFLTAEGWRWIAWEEYAIKNDKGETVEIQAIGRDITEGKQAEERLKSRTADLESAKIQLEEDNAKDDALLSSIGDGMIATDNFGKITKINSTAENMLGGTSAEMIGGRIQNIIEMENEKGEPVLETDHPTTLALYRGQKIIDHTYFYIRKDGSKFPAEVTVTPVVLNEKIIGTIEVFRDITKEMEIDRAKSELLSLASHQLRTPLSTISWYSEALLKEYTGPISIMQKNYMDQIYRTTHKMIRLVNDFLNVSRIELGTLPADPESVNLTEIAKSAIDELGALIKEKRVKVNQNYGEQIPIINADPHHMRMIFQNLLTNAVKYTETEGEIWVEILTEQERVIIKVTDTGCGIPQAQQSKIFTKFFRADNVKGQDTEGTGLGLYIVKSIVTQSNGEIWFESEEGKGSAFYIAIPLYQS